MYCDCDTGEVNAIEDGYTSYTESSVYSPKAYAVETAQVRDFGYTVLKFDLDFAMDNDSDPFNGPLSNATIERKREIDVAVRDEFGPKADLASDFHWDTPSKARSASPMNWRRTTSRCRPTTSAARSARWRASTWARRYRTSTC